VFETFLVSCACSCWNLLLGQLEPSKILAGIQMRDLELFTEGS